MIEPLLRRVMNTRRDLGQPKEPEDVDIEHLRHFGVRYHSDKPVAQHARVVDQNVQSFILRHERAVRLHRRSALGDRAKYDRRSPRMIRFEFGERRDGLVGILASVQNDTASGL